MGLVTSVALICSCSEGSHDEGVPAIASVNRWLREHCDAPKSDGNVLVQVDQHAGGTKGFEANLFIGGFNYLDVDGFVQAVRAAPWQDPKRVQLLIRREGDEGFEGVRMTGKVYVLEHWVAYEAGDIESIHATQEGADTARAKLPKDGRMEGYEITEHTLEP